MKKRLACLVLRSWAVLVGAASIAGAGACSSGDEAALTNFSIKFPSTTAAIATDTLLVYAFDATGAPQTFCATLLAARNSRSNWPVPPLASSPPIRPCQVLGSGNALATPPVPFGDRALVAVGQKDGRDTLVGCLRATFDGQDLPSPLTLTSSPSSTANFAPTKCASFRDSCEGKCPN